MRFVGTRCRSRAGRSPGKGFVRPGQERTDDREHGGNGGRCGKSPRHEDLPFEKRKDSPGDLPGGPRKAERACSTPFLENVTKPVDVCVVKGPDFLTDLPGKGSQVGRKDGEQAKTILLGQERGEKRHVVGQTSFRPAIFSADPAKCGQKAVVVPANQGARQIVLSGKMIMDAGCADADPVCNIPITEGIEAPKLDQLLGGIQDELCRVGRHSHGQESTYS